MVIHGVQIAQSHAIPWPSQVSATAASCFRALQVVALRPPEEIPRTGWTRGSLCHCSWVIGVRKLCLELIWMTGCDWMIDFHKIHEIEGYLDVLLVCSRSIEGMFEM